MRPDVSIHSQFPDRFADRDGAKFGLPEHEIWYRKVLLCELRYADANQVPSPYNLVPTKF
jgi:hypothetical protein